MLIIIIIIINADYYAGCSQIEKKELYKAGEKTYTCMQKLTQLKAR